MNSLQNLQQRLVQRIPKHIKNTSSFRRSYEDVLAERRAEEQKQLAHFSKLRAGWIARNSGMSEKFKLCTFDNYVVENDDQRKAIAYAKRYAETFEEQMKTGKGFMFIGNPGTGKNHLAAAIANSIGERFKTALVITVSDMVGLIRRSWSKDEHFTESEIINRFASVDLLVIDEVGLQRGTEDEHLQLTKVIDKRLYNFKPTSIISNCKTVDEIKHFIGFRAYDRLKEGTLFSFEFNWESYRGRGA